MATKPKVLIFGAGGIGTEVKRQAEDAGFGVVGQFTSRALVERDGTRHFDTAGDMDEIIHHVRRLCERERITLAYAALPSGGDGSVEWSYIETILSYDAYVVTAGKSTMAGQFDKAVHCLDRIGTTATVGGGTRILPFLEGWLNRGKPFRIGLVVNGTMSKILSDVWRGRGLEAALGEAVRLKYAEPSPDGGAPDPLVVFSGEVEDVRKKLTIIRHVMFRDTAGIGKPEDISMVGLDMPYLRHVTAQNSRMKYVASMGTDDRPLVGLNDGAPGSLSAKLGNIFVRAGFCHIPQGSAMDRWVPDDGPGNAVNLDQGGFPLILSGEGAGPDATVGSMMADTRVFLRQLGSSSQAKGMKMSPSLARVDERIA